MAKELRIRGHVCDTAIDEPSISESASPEPSHVGKSTAVNMVKKQPAMRPRKYKQWSPEDMRYAMNMVLNGSTFEEAASDCGIPERTLRDRLPIAVVSRVLEEKEQMRGKSNCVPDVPVKKTELEDQVLQPSIKLYEASASIRGAVELVCMGAPIDIASKQYKIPVSTLEHWLTESKCVPKMVEVDESKTTTPDDRSTSSKAPMLSPAVVDNNSLENPSVTSDPEVVTLNETQYSTLQGVEHADNVVEIVTIPCETVAETFELDGSDGMLVGQSSMGSLETREGTQEDLYVEVEENAIQDGYQRQIEVPHNQSSQTNSRKPGYTPEDLAAAVESVLCGTTVKIASTKYGIPYDTLRHRIVQGPKVVTRASCHLTAEDEEELKSHIIGMKETGQAVSVEWVRNLAGQLAKKRGKPFPVNDLPSYGWWKKFKQRHPEVCRIPSVREAISEQIPSAKKSYRFFREAQRLLESLDVMDKSERIYVMDECCIGGGAECRKDKVIFPKEGEAVPFTEHVTFTHCVSAAGQWMPPMFTFEDTLPLTHEYMINGPANSINISNDTGRPNNEGYLLYLKHLEPFLSQERPVIVFHTNMFLRPRQEIMDFCRDHEIHLFHVPRTQAHIAHPLDELFEDFKSMVENKYQEASILVSPAAVDKGKIPILIRFAMQSLLDKNTLSEAFRVTGLYPFSERAVLDKVGSGSNSQLQNNIGIHEESNIDDETMNESQVAVADMLTAEDMNSHDIRHAVDVNVALKNDKTTQTDPVLILPIDTPIHQSVTNEGTKHKGNSTKSQIDWSSLYVKPEDFNMEKKVQRDKVSRVKREQKKGVVVVQNVETTNNDPGLIGADGTCCTCYELADNTWSCEVCESHYHIDCCDDDHGHSSRVCRKCPSDGVSPRKKRSRKTPT